VIFGKRWKGEERWRSTGEEIRREKKNWRMKNVQKENKKEKKYLICNATSECTHLNARNVI